MAQNFDLKDRPSEDEIDYVVESLATAEEDITEDELEEIKDRLKQEKADLDDALHMLGSKLDSKFGEFSRRRGTKEQEWISAILQYRGNVDDYNEKEVYEQGVKRTPRKPKINLTAHKCNMAIARMLDIQLPLGGDFNFHLDPSPDPDLEELIGSEEPIPQEPELTQGQVAKAGLSENIDKAKRMQLKIQNSLSESDWGRLTREGMRDWVILGTAVMEGPSIRKKFSKSYKNHEDSEGGMWSEVVKESDYKALADRVDLRYFYPDPDCLVPEELTEAFKVRPITRSELIKFGKDDCFMKERVRQILDKGPDALNDSRVFTLNGIIDSESSLKNKYVLKIYHGPLDKEVLKYMDIATEEDVEDEFTEIFGEVWFINGEVIRVSVSPLDGDDRLPFHIVVWEKDDTSLFGHGMPYKMKDQQKVTDSAWHMLLDNAGLSAGPQLAINKEMIEPANGKWDIEAFKIWWMTEYGARVQDAIQFVDIPNNQESLARVIEMSMQFADIESESPMISHNMLPQANNTSGMGLVLTEANVSQRELSHAWDKYVIVPLVKRYVDYYMQYDDDPRIKGNFDVRVGAATQRIDNQIIAQEIERILGMAEQDPMYKVQIDPKAAFRKWAASSRVGPEILRSSEEVDAEIAQMEEQMANQPPDPQAMRAEASLMREKTREQEIQTRTQVEQVKLEQEAEEREWEHYMKELEMYAKEQDRQIAREKFAHERDLQLMELADRREITLAEMQAKIGIATMSNETARVNKQLDFQKFREQAKLKREHGTGVSGS